MTLPSNVRLPISFAPEAYESFSGFVIRLCEANYYAKTGWVYSLLSSDLPKQSYSFLSRCADEMPNILGLPFGALDKVAYRPIAGGQSNKVLLFGRERIDPALISLQRQKFCPECLAENPIMRFVWDLLYFVACPKHQCVLLDRCQECDKPLSWLRPKLTECSYCSADLSTAAVKQAPKAVIDLCSQIEAKTPHASCGTGSNICVEWDAVSLSNLLENIQLVTRQSRVGSGNSIKHSVEKGVSVLEEVANVFSDWPRGFHNYLQERIKQAAKDGSIFGMGVRSVFGRLYAQLMVEDVNGKYGLLKRGFADFVYQQLDPSLAFPGNRSSLRQIRVEEEYYLTKQEVLARLGISKPVLERLLNANVLQSKVWVQGRRKQCRICAKSVSEYSQVSEKLLGRDDVAKGLGVSRPFVDQLLRSKWLEPYRGPGIDGSQRWLVGADLIQDIFDEIDQQVRPIFLSPQSYLSYTDAYHSIANRGLGGLQFLDLVCGGEIPTRFVDETNVGLDRYFFLAADLSLQHPKESVSVADAQKILAYSNSTMNWLLKRGETVGFPKAYLSEGEEKLYFPAVMKFAEKYTIFDQIEVWCQNKEEARRFRRRLPREEIVGPVSPIVDCLIPTKRALQFLMSVKFPLSKSRRKIQAKQHILEMELAG